MELLNMTLHCEQSSLHLFLFRYFCLSGNLVLYRCLCGFYISIMLHHAHCLKRRVKGCGGFWLKAVLGPWSLESQAGM